jgi:hypothetical protein
LRNEFKNSWIWKNLWRDDIKQSADVNLGMALGKLLKKTIKENVIQIIENLEIMKLGALNCN